MRQHALDDAVSAPAVLSDLAEVAGDHLDRLTELRRARPRPSRPARGWAAAFQARPAASTERPAKLLTKLSGFLISCAMPALSCSRAGHLLGLDQVGLGRTSRRSSESRSSVNSRTFSMAITACAANASSNSIWRGVNAPGVGLREQDRSQSPGPREAWAPPAA